MRTQACTFHMHRKEKYQQGVHVRVTRSYLQVVGDITAELFCLSLISVCVLKKFQ